jgi:hypothetical protein
MISVFFLSCHDATIVGRGLLIFAETLEFKAIYAPWQILGFISRESSLETQTSVPVGPTQPE